MSSDHLGGCFRLLRILGALLPGAILRFLFSSEADCTSNSKVFCFLAWRYSIALSVSRIRKEVLPEHVGDSGWVSTFCVLSALAAMEVVSRADVDA